ncbi:unnamed protein product [Trifolium pratense]|uniref:Uncharacterized protein n=1 Tax=Trifolium pratense TaxID=57577 RepID=A0ACB0LL41_TRIPR|nr:unnamed protein product [Trifolium pratense]
MNHQLHTISIAFVWRNYEQMKYKIKLYEYMMITFITCLLHFSHKNVLESKYTDLLQMYLVDDGSSLPMMFLIVAKNGDGKTKVTCNINV